MAVQGGLLASAISNNSSPDEQEPRNKLWGTGAFLVAKLATHLVLGFLLGWLGEAVRLTPAGLGAVQVVAGVYMLGVGLAMLEVHPIFRYFVIQPPKFLRSVVRNQSKSKSMFGPAVLGAMTVFIPCGTTQAMMALAISTGSPAWGAAVMGTFVLGTSPLFMGLGLLISKLGEAFRERFMKIAAWAVVGMAVWGLNSASVLLGSPFTVQRILASAECVISFCDGGTGGMVSDRVTVEISRSGYAVSNAVKAGESVKMTLVNTDGRGCQQAVTIPSLGISRIVRPGQRQEISFKAPGKPGRVDIACSMGMFTAELNVI